jgi:hypothetical protein
MVDDEVRRALKLLETLMAISGRNRQEIDGRLGEGRGYSSQLLTGRVDLKYQHILAFLEVVEIEPGIFFRILFPDSLEQHPGTEDRTLERLFQQLHKAGYGAPVEPPAPSPQGVDPEERERRIRAAIREALGGPPRG